MNTRRSCYFLPDLPPFLSSGLSSCRTWRPEYVPQLAQALCCNLGCLHLGQAAKFAFLSPECEFRRFLFEAVCRRAGTDIYTIFKAESYLFRL